MEGCNSLVLFPCMHLCPCRTLGTGGCQNNQLSVQQRMDNQAKEVSFTSSKIRVNVSMNDIKQLSDALEMQLAVKIDILRQFVCGYEVHSFHKCIVFLCSLRAPVRLQKLVKRENMSRIQRKELIKHNWLTMLHTVSCKSPPHIIGTEVTWAKTKIKLQTSPYGREPQDAR